MEFGRTKLLLAFALLGFFIGTFAYYIFDWVVLNASLKIQPVPILEILTAPWFISGIVGSFLAMGALYLTARFTGDK